DGIVKVVVIISDAETVVRLKPPRLVYLEVKANRRHRSRALGLVLLSTFSVQDDAAINAGNFCSSEVPGYPARRLAGAARQIVVQRAVPQQRVDIVCILVRVPEIGRKRGQNVLVPTLPRRHPRYAELRRLKRCESEGF